MGAKENPRSRLGPGEILRCGLVPRLSALEADSLPGRAWAGLFGLEVIQPEIHGVVMLGIIEFSSCRLGRFVRTGRFDERFAENGFGVGNAVFAHGKFGERK